ncbi:MAG: T9SS type A sorting domain-containing protein [Bacteroidota bacterium]|nr:T9SS type A sorting domain-containing protein [Bacteroidota bacterium]
MRTRNLLYAFLLATIMGAATKANAQQDTVNPQNNTEMNHYSYLPKTYERGSSTAEIKMFPNPARNEATLYINSIKEQDGGDMIVYNTSGTAVMRNTVRPGNNSINVGNLSSGIYIVKVISRDKSIYTQQLVVSK